MTAKTKSAPATPAAPAVQSAETADETPVQAADEKEGGVTQDTPTQMPKRDTYGFEIDDFGLPVNGVVRARVLGEMKLGDPAADPQAQAEDDVKPAQVAKIMEKFYG